ncbi:hypothetical protein [Legionella sp. W05-934-2]|uniref:hypothetical protein n=1 Tax=Legionella sp. W05-934-2 TaxID=1198649 RepID=UPI0034631A4E
MTLKTFFTSIGQDANYNFEHMIKHKVIDQVMGVFDPYQSSYQQSIATPLTRYHSFSEFAGHFTNLFSSFLMAIPNLVLGVLSVCCYAAIGLAILAAKLIALPFRVLFGGLFSGSDEGFLSAMGSSLENATKGLIGSLIKWSLVVANSLLETAVDVLLMPALFTATLATKSTTSVVATVGDAFVGIKNYCLPEEPAQTAETLNPNI